MLEIFYLSISDLKPYSKNTRKHAEKDVRNIKKSIEDYGMNDPIGIWSDKNIIVEGHGRFEACKQLGMTEVPCIRLDHLTDKQRREYAIAHNATAELSEWDFDILAEEILDLDLDDFDFGFDFDTEETTDNELYEEKMLEFQERMASGELSEDSEEYQEFLAKFEAKKTTDDCYTPPIVYEAIADYVARKYNLEKSRFVRPFYPGGDYRSEKYKSSDIVVDNPPFSILAEIITYYTENKVKFFLFAPHLTIFSSASASASAICCGSQITYENGARVCTSFVTNLESCAFRSCPELFRVIKEADETNLRATHKELPKYKYPLEVMTATMLTGFSRYGINFEVEKDECFFIRQMDAQKEAKKGLFGSGYLISENKKAEREKAEREKAEREKAEVWELSEREKEIVKKLK